MIGSQVWRADDRLLGVYVGDDGGDLRVVVAEVAKRPGDRLVDDRHRPAADKLLRLDETEIGLDAGRVTVEHERNRAGRCQDRGLRVAHAVLLTVADRRLPRLLAGADDVGRHGIATLDVLGGVAVHAQNAQHVLLVGGESGERTHPRRRAGRGRVRMTGQERRDRRRPGAPGAGVVGQPEGHQQRTEVGIAETELAEGVGVLGDLLGRVVGSSDEDLLGREDDLHRVSEGIDVEAVRIEERQQVQRSEIARGVVEVDELRAVAHDNAVSYVRMVSWLGEVVGQFDSVVGALGRAESSYRLRTGRDVVG